MADVYSIFPLFVLSFYSSLFQKKKNIQTTTKTKVKSAKSMCQNKLSVYLAAIKDTN